MKFRGVGHGIYLDPPIQVIQMILAITVLDTGQNGPGVISGDQSRAGKDDRARWQDGELVVQPCLRHCQPSLVPALLVDGEQLFAVEDPIDDVHRNVPTARLSFGTHDSEGLIDRVSVSGGAGGKAVKEQVSKDEADEIKGKLEAAGAEVELK